MAVQTTNGTRRFCARLTIAAAMRYARRTMAWLKTVVSGGVGYAVAGPAGALVGVALSGGYDNDRGYDMSDIPTGVHVEADWVDDDAGRRWTLRFLSEIPAHALAEMQFLNDAGLRLAGRGPFNNAEDHFTAAAHVRKRRATLYVPFGAIEYESPRNISMEVIVSDTSKGKLGVVGKGILDADLPAPRPLETAEYLKPFVALCSHIKSAASNQAELQEVMKRLAKELDVAQLAGAKAEMDRMMAHAASPLSVQAAVRLAQFRFPGVGAEGFAQLLNAACFEKKGSAAEKAKLAEIEALLA